MGDRHERDAALARAREVLAGYIASKGLKATRQRDLIADTFLAQPGHLNVDELLERVRALDSRISPATVYRTMRLLAECGLAAPRRFEDGQTRYEPAVGRHHHDHLICTRCRAILEFEDESIEALQQEVARRHRFRVDHHRLELYGLCARCQESEAAEAPEDGDER